MCLRQQQRLHVSGTQTINTNTLNGTDTLGVKSGTQWTTRNTNASGPVPSGGDVQFDFGLPNDLPVVRSVPAT